MPVAAAISIHPVQASHRTSHGPRAAGVHGHGKKSGPDFGEVLRGQTGQASATGEGGSGKPGVKAKQDSEQASMRRPAEAKADLEISATGPAQSRSKTAAHEDSPSVRLRAFLQGGVAAANSKAPDAAPAIKTGDLKGGEVMPSPHGPDAAKVKAAEDEDGKAGEAGRTDKTGKPGKTGKEEDKAGKADKKDQTVVAQTGAVKLPQVTVQAAAPVVAAVSTPLISVPSAKVEGAPPPHSASATAAAKSAPGKQGQQTTQASNGKKIQGTTDGKGLPVPDVTSASQDIQPGAEGLTENVDSAEVSDLKDVKSAGKQDAAATTSHSEVVPQVKHLNPPSPAVAHSAQVGQTAAGGTGEIAAHITVPTQNFAGVSGAISVASGPTVGGASPYDRIDQGAAPVVLHSSSQQVAVGVHDPSLGWVEIKTQSAAGHVDATLVASSGQTHDALAAQLPAISQFLEQRDVRVGTLIVNHQSGTNHFGNGSGGGGAGARHAGPGFGGNGGNGGSSGNNGSQHHAPRSNAPALTRPSAPTMRTGGDGSSSARPLSYISVRA